MSAAVAEAGLFAAAVNVCRNAMGAWPAAVKHMRMCAEVLVTRRQCSRSVYELYMAVAAFLSQAGCQLQLAGLLCGCRSACSEGYGHIRSTALAGYCAALCCMCEWLELHVRLHVDSAILCTAATPPSGVHI